MSTAELDTDYRDAWHGSWRRDGLIQVPVGVTAEDRFGDVVRERARAQRRWDAAVVAVADEHGRCDVFALADALRPRWWQ